MSFYFKDPENEQIFIYDFFNTRLLLELNKMINLINLKLKNMKKLGLVAVALMFAVASFAAPKHHHHRHHKKHHHSHHHTMNKDDKKGK